MYFQVKPSSHDYIGIYPRDWKDLREFVGFEHPIAAPFEEDNLYRIIQFTCQSPHVTASLNQDYQFVYVDQSQQVTEILSSIVFEYEVKLLIWVSFGFLSPFNPRSLVGATIFNLEMMIGRKAILQTGGWKKRMNGKMTTELHHRQLKMQAFNLAPMKSPIMSASSEIQTPSMIQTIHMEQLMYVQVV